MYSIDLNSDMGECFGAYKLGGDEAIIKYVTTANVACGWHAGDPMVTPGSTMTFPPSHYICSNNCSVAPTTISENFVSPTFLRDMLPPLKSYDFEVGASCSIAF